MSNIADAEAHAAWLAERPTADLPDPADYAWPDLPGFSPAKASVCLCSADPLNDPRHACPIHPPF